MLEVAEALAEVLARVRPLEPVDASLFGGALGRVLADDARADADSPPFAKSLRDGYALRAADCVKPNADLRIVAEIAAGSVSTTPINPGECARIFTGAPMPDGADTVVMQEDTHQLSDSRVRITDANVKPRQWVYARGTEMRAGDVVLPAGTELNPAALGVLAGLGRAQARLYPRPIVSVVATGSEIVQPGAALEPGQIYNSNGPMLAALVERCGGDVTDRALCSDQPNPLRNVIANSLDGADVLVIAGGVSVGKFDLVPGILEELGAAIHFRQVRMKPGKPLLFGTKDRTLVFGLPGNPVSTFVCFELFVKPALRAMQGHAAPHPTTLSLPLAEGIAMVNDRPSYYPAKIEIGESGQTVRPLPWSGAPDLRGLQPADALLVLPPGETRLAAGQLVSIVVLSGN